MLLLLQVLRGQPAAGAEAAAVFAAAPLESDDPDDPDVEDDEESDEFDSDEEDDEDESDDPGVLALLLDRESVA